MEGPIPFADPCALPVTPPMPAINVRQNSGGVVCTEHWACEAYGRVCPNYASNAGRAARRALEKMAHDSRIIRQRIVGEGDDAHAAIDTAEFRPCDILFGRLLGRGGFSEVHDARLLTTPPESSFASTSSMELDPTAPMTSCPAVSDEDTGSGDDDGRNTCDGSHRYVVKYLRRSVMVDRKKFARGAADLVIEASLLSALDHPNIIRLLGVTAGPVEEKFASGKDHGFFLVLDRLYETLDQKIEKWKEAQSKYAGFVFRATHDPRGKLRRAALMERLQITKSLADAVRYLHQQNVAFRDLKPENIGFNQNGVLKLFDFGLAKELKSHRRLANGTYQLTGNTGSRRYMAPEVAEVKPYNLSVDAYSFGILLWEICALEKPFDGFTETNHRELIVIGGGRPEICPYGAHSYWPAGLQDLISGCWHQNLFERPSFAFIVNQLERCLQDATSNGYLPSNSKSTTNKAARGHTKADRLKRSSRAKKRVGSLVRSASEKIPNSDTSNKSSGHSNPEARIHFNSTA
mmetsp:Transcript_6305/g.13162  ORF Transcript_6305/g.13162 Transcript_6305/m.13162 type:complete len:519 (-) Transcript_6305:212-1768(-)|eukprot:CAMPEP_0178611868 /NCGR_PEP_ID=MMETSP0698-20121128/832_1 /TAXON_ID=265572 /ORGANISM="Extubocellulus spinifer, Strain CCMP396" /LENGTH=518 /DNA_ID=CAMNT_0020250509 /DNA_START=117 /DNA_END=1673 /DNA_ORIENTATION=+